MDLKLHLDFCFSVSADRVLAAGWSPRPQPEIVLHAGHASVPPVLLRRFPRRDLRSLSPMGFLALFDLSQEPGANDPSEDLFLGMGKEYVPITDDRLASDIAKMVEIGVDEAFFSYIRMIARGEVPAPGQPITRKVVNRILAAPRLERESQDHALGIDRALIGPDGQGIATGWFLGANRQAETMTALVICDGRIAPVDLMQASLPRADLAAYAPRYAFSGRDGWAASFRLPQAPKAQPRLLLMPPGHLDHSGHLAPLDMVQPAEVARLILETGQGLEDQALARRLHRNALPAEIPAAPVLSIATDPKAPVLLVLDHDLNDIDLRDVLRRVTAVLERPLTVHLLRPALTPALDQALAGAAREAAAPLTLAGCALTPPEPGGHDGLAIFARSSVLFHLDPEILLAPLEKSLLLATLDPMAALPGGGDEAALQRRFAADRPPFACCGSAAALLAPFALPSAYLTPEAGWRALALRALAQDEARIIAAPAQGFLAGNRGPFCQSLIEGVGWHEFDGRSALLLTEAA
ncbi:hypothetical protein [Paracoccus sp. NSM]|uniref:hypothetical protein n=1 Tax=Paracoccus sp. NSM TaxID=3457784 RepID=UPI0040351A8A